MDKALLSAPRKGRAWAAPGLLGQAMGLRVRNQWLPLNRASWSEGSQLEVEIACTGALHSGWRGLWLELKQEWGRAGAAGGTLQKEQVLRGTKGEALRASAWCLVGSEEECSLEVGHPA